VHSVHQVWPSYQGYLIRRVVEQGDAHCISEDNVTRSSSEEAAFVSGEIIGIEKTRIRVRLDSGIVGVVLLSDQETEMPTAVQMGQRQSFQVVSSGTSDAAPVLAFSLDCRDTAANEPFDRDIVKLQTALANHHVSPSSSAPPIERVHLGEEQIRSWMDRVEASIGRLKKNRARRLDEEFYNGS